MKTYLCPTQDHAYLTVAQIIDRLRSLFRTVVPDNRQGLVAVASRAREQNPHFTHAELDSLLTFLADSTVVIVADDPTSDTYFLRSLVVPNEPIQVEWIYPEHQGNCEELLQRFADALGYTLCCVK